MKEEKNLCHIKVCAFRCLTLRPQNLVGLEIKFVENYFFLENYVTSEGAASHNVLYHQAPPITCHQERLYANNYFELLPIVSTAFNIG